MRRVIEGIKADGMDLLEVLEVGEKALSYVREKKRPFILELDTYRYRGHSMSDPALYRTKEEVAGVKENRDPITTFKDYALKHKLLTEENLKEIESQVKETVAQAVKFSEESPEPELSELWTDVLVETA